VRANIARKVVGENGMTFAEVARNVGGSITDICKIMSVKEVKLGNNVPCYYCMIIFGLQT